MSPKLAKGRLRRFYVFYLIYLKNEPQIGRRPIKEILCLIFNVFEKWAPNRPKADKGDFWFNFVENVPQIGRKNEFQKNRPIWKEVFKIENNYLILKEN
jgi:hypothetical protein